MACFFQTLAALIAAGSFSLAVVETLSAEPFQHSGNQPYVRVIR